MPLHKYRTADSQDDLLAPGSMLRHRRQELVALEIRRPSHPPRYKSNLLAREPGKTDLAKLIPRANNDPTERSDIE
jgi:hypothetical protein